MTVDPLERSYRWLLLAYPRPYRRRHGAEILTTLMEMAAPGQRRPPSADSRHLIACGIRQRFRLPARRPFAVVGAVLAVLVVAGFGAAAGSWLGWQSAADLPGQTASTAAVRALGGSGPVNAGPIASPWTSTLYLVSAENPTHRTAEQMQRILAGQGWQRLSRQEQSGEFIEAVADARKTVSWPWHTAEFVSVRSGVRLEVTESLDRGRGAVSLSYAPVQPAAVPSLVILFAVIGGVLGWLAAAAIMQRRRNSPAVLGLAALLVLAIPTMALYSSTLEMLRSTRVAFGLEPVVHAAFTPTDLYFQSFDPRNELGLGPLILVLSIGGAVLALIAATLACFSPAVRATAGTAVRAD